MKKEELNKILDEHTKWLNHNEGKRADLRGADLRKADLRKADLDFSVLNFSCKGLDFKIDDRLAKQIMYHLLNLMQYSNIDTKPYFKKKAFEYVNSSHLISEHDMPEIKEIK